MEAGIAVLIL